MLNYRNVYSEGNQGLVFELPVLVLQSTVGDVWKGKSVLKARE